MPANLENLPVATGIESVFIPIPQKGNAKECSNYRTIALISHANLPCGSAGRESTCNAGDLGSIPGLRRYLTEGKGYLLQLSGLENSMDYIVHGVAKSWTHLSDFDFFTSLVISMVKTLLPHCQRPGFNLWLGN